jgi:hypothetical protein
MRRNESKYAKAECNFIRRRWVVGRVSERTSVCGRHKMNVCTRSSSMKIYMLCVYYFVIVKMFMWIRIYLV